jgi:signal transduction histidine kinase
MVRKPDRPSRQETDARLGDERGKTDEELAKATSTDEEAADKVMDVARQRAAEVLLVAREHADAQLPSSKSTQAEQARTGQARTREDEALRREYARVDAAIANERTARARLVAALLVDERQGTDRSLLLERVDADAIVARRDEFLGMVSHDLRNEMSGIALSVAWHARRCS